VQHHNREIMWEHHPSMAEVMANSWRRNKPVGDLGTVAVALKEMMKELRSWSKENFGNITKEIEQLRG